MKLLLTSTGLVNKKLGDFLVSLLDKQPYDCTALMLPLNLTTQGIRYTEDAKRELITLGIEKINVFNLKDDEFLAFSSYPDLIYVCGGNAFAILGAMKKSGVFEYVKESVKRGTVYVGVSAGSIIAGQSIEIAGCYGDKNEIGITDLSGLGFTDIAIYPHFHSELKERVDEFKKKVNYPVIEIADYQAVYVEGGNHQII